MDVKIKIIPDSWDDDILPSCDGKISIGNDFCDVFTMALNYWGVEDYERQWREGLERIEKYDTSCLVASAQNPLTSARHVDYWVLCKVGEKVFVKNYLLVAELYEELIGDNDFTPETCYNFIPERDNRSIEGFKPSQWEIEL